MIILCFFFLRQLIQSNDGNTVSIIPVHPNAIVGIPAGFPCAVRQLQEIILGTVGSRIYAGTLRPGSALILVYRGQKTYGTTDGIYHRQSRLPWGTGISVNLNGIIHNASVLDRVGTDGFIDGIVSIIPGSSRLCVGSWILKVCYIVADRDIFVTIGRRGGGSACAPVNGPIGGQELEGVLRLDGNLEKIGIAA